MLTRHIRESLQVTPGPFPDFWWDQGYGQGSSTGTEDMVRGSLLGPRIWSGVLYWDRGYGQGSLYWDRGYGQGSSTRTEDMVRGPLLGPRICSGVLYWDRGCGLRLSESLAASPDELRDVSLNILSFLLLSREAWRNLPTPAFSPPFSSFLCCRSSIILSVSLSSACTEQHGCEIARGKEDRQEREEIRPLSKL